MKNITIMKSIHGSHLYGLNTESSDKDYKSIFIPKSWKDVALRKDFDVISHSTSGDCEKNGSKDVDEDSFGLRRFIKMCCEGEMIALDMIHTPPNMILKSSATWEYIYTHRSKFYTKNMKAYIGYARKQAAKYGIKGSRIASLEEVIEIITPIFKNHSVIRSHKILDIKEQLPVSEHQRWYEKETPSGKQIFYEVLGKSFQDNSNTYTMYQSLSNMYQKYGQRAMEAKRNEGVDWKAVSHALRAAYQLEEIYLFGDLEYPLMEQEYLLKVKKGELDFIDEVQPVLEAMIDKVKKLADNSKYPQTVDKALWDDFIYQTYKEFCLYV